MHCRSLFQGIVMPASFQASYIISSESGCRYAACREQRGRCSVGLEPYGIFMMPPHDALVQQPLPSRSSAAVLLSKGVARLEGTLKLTTAILALPAGVYTSLRVRKPFHRSPG